MKAAVLKERRHLIVEDIPLFPLAADEVMLQVEACGVCGSDLRYYQDVTINLTDLGGERAWRGSSNYLIPEFQMTVDLFVSGQIKTAPWITHRVTLDQVPEVFTLLLDKESTLAFKAVVEPIRV